MSNHVKLTIGSNDLIIFYSNNSNNEDESKKEISFTNFSCILNIPKSNLLLLQFFLMGINMILS